MSSLHPSSPAQLSSRGPAQGIAYSVPSGLPPSVPGAPEEPAVKQADGITDVPSLSRGDTLLRSNVLSPNTD